MRFLPALFLATPAWAAHSGVAKARTSPELSDIALFVMAAWRYEGALDDSAYPTTAFCIGLVVGAIALLLYWRERRGADAPERSPVRRWFAPAALLFAAIHALAIAASLLFPRMPQGVLAATTLIGRHWTIPWAILIAVSLAQAHYADVVLKRSLWLLASVALRQRGAYLFEVDRRPVLERARP